jgi:hypothetical protein
MEIAVEYLDSDAARNDALASTLQHRNGVGRSISEASID